MPNPANPSEPVETLDNGRSDAIGADDLLNIFAALLRGLCLLGAFLLFCVGAYFGLVVFSHIRLTIMDPESAKTSPPGTVASSGWQIWQSVAKSLDSGKGEGVRPMRLTKTVRKASGRELRIRA